MSTGPTFAAPKWVQAGLGTVEGVGIVANSVLSPFLAASTENKRLEVQKAEAKLAAEREASNRAAQILNSDKLYNITKWLAIGVFAMSLAVSAGLLFRKKRKGRK